MPWNPGRMAQAGFDYIACGHIHKPGILIPDKMAYAGALEPTDETQMGRMDISAERWTSTERGFVLCRLPDMSTRIWN